MNFKKIAVDKKDSIYYIGFGLNEKKSLTTLSPESMQELHNCLDNIANDREARGVIFHSVKEGIFLAGVDITLIDSLESEAMAVEGSASGQTIFNKIEDLKIPTLCLIDGFCLGGGLELALSCNHIAVSDSENTKLGLPEVMLGVLPGFGGTYRLPKKVGLANALDMILSGRQVRGKSAFKMGLADFIMPKERLMANASEYLFKKPSKRESFSDGVMSFAEGSFVGKKFIFRKAREGVLSKTKGFYPAPLKILDLIEKNLGRNREDYLFEEAKAFAELSQTKQSKSLLNVFKLQDGSKKFESNEQLTKIEHGAVLGAGTMGGGIAWYFSKNNVSCYMKDLSSHALELGLKQAGDNFKRALKKRHMTQDEYQRKMSLIQPTLSYAGFQGVELLIEAIVEDMNIKKKVLAEAETKVNKKTILTSNTSSLSVDELAKSLQDSSRFAGLHFFNPVHLMPLVEIIRHEAVSQATIDTLYRFVLDTKKTPVVVNDGPGFLVNRVLATYLNESSHMLEEGYLIEEIDQAALDFGMPMGPCHLMDEVGLDVASKVAKVIYEGLGERMKSPKLNQDIMDLGFLGKKNSKGFYLYENGKKGVVNPELTECLPQQKKSAEAKYIQQRIILPMVNEACYCLAEGIVDRAEDIDLAMIFGIGFPPFRGGLLKYAETEGLERVVTAIRQFAEEVSPERFKLSSLLETKAKNQEKFY